MWGLKRRCWTNQNNSIQYTRSLRYMYIIWISPWDTLRRSSTDGYLLSFGGNQFLCSYYFKWILYCYNICRAPNQLFKQLLINRKHTQIQKTFNQVARKSMDNYGINEFKTLMVVGPEPVVHIFSFVNHMILNSKGRKSQKINVIRIICFYIK